MNITLFTDYSLRVLTYLAACDPQPARIKEIADRYKISKNHLMKVVQLLGAEGYLYTVRGRNGGISLKMPAEKINVGHLVRIMEKGPALVECFGDNNQCVLTPSCRLKHVLAEAIEGFFQILEQYTLYDLVNEKNRQKLGKLLMFSADFPRTDSLPPD